MKTLFLSKFVSDIEAKYIVDNYIQYGIDTTSCIVIFRDILFILDQDEALDMLNAIGQNLNDNY